MAKEDESSLEDYPDFNLKDKVVSTKGVMLGIREMKTIIIVEYNGLSPCSLLFCYYFCYFYHLYINIPLCVFTHKGINPILISLF